jgi:hypothetical protein
MAASVDAENEEDYGCLLLDLFSGMYLEGVIEDFLVVFLGGPEICF